jgi:hypothetical protein
MGKSVIEYYQQRKQAWSLFWIVLALALSTCGKDEITSRNYPRITTTGVSDISNTGVTLHAEIFFSPGAILDCGFVASTSSSPTLPLGNSISLGPKTGTGTFQARMDNGLIPGITYYARAYARTSQYLVYGDIVQFVSNGSNLPLIIDFQPKSGTWGDTVVITGQYLTHDVRFGTFASSFVKGSETRIVASVPLEFLGPASLISVALASSVTRTGQPFNLLPPTIDDFSPKSGAVDDHITVIGKRFHPTELKVFVNDTLAVIAKQSTNYAVIKVPGGLHSGKKAIKVLSGLQSAISGQDFLYQAPTIASFSPANAFFGDVITINGTYFGPDVLSNTVLFDGAPAQILSATNTQISVKVPEQISVPIPNVTVTYKQQVSRPVGFPILPPLFSGFSPNRGTTGTVITLTGKFNPSSANNSVKFGGVNGNVTSSTGNQIVATIPNDLTSHQLSVEVLSSGVGTLSGNTIQSPWAMVQNFPDPYGCAGSLVIGSRYFAIGSNIQQPYTIIHPTSRVYELDPATGHWIQRADAPPFSDSYFFSFSSNGKGYVGNESYQAPLWEYDPNADTWTEKNVPDFMNGGTSPYAFTLQDQGYILVSNQCWIYNSQNDTWTQQPGFPNINPRGGFVVAGRIYLYDVPTTYPATAKLWEFDPSAGTWQQLGSLPVQSNLISIAFTFSAAGNGYMGTNVGALWKYSPGSDTWSRESLNYGGVPLAWSLCVFSTGSRGYVISGYQQFDPNHVGPTSESWEFDPSY